MAADIQQILKSPKLPTLPAVAVKLLRLIGTDEPDTDAICETIKTDPALSARILKSANSSYYGLRTSVKSLEHAALLLGPGALTSICLTFALSSSSLPGGVAADNFRRYWLHSVLQAVATETVARRRKSRDASTYFLSGLLCDIGTLAILKTLPDEYHQVLEIQHSSDNDYDIIAIEREVLGVDHVAVGTQLAEVWTLPETFAKSIQYHHASVDELEPIRQEDSFELIAASAFASSAGDFLSRGQQAGDHSRLINQARSLLGLEDETTLELLGTVRTRSDSLPDDFGIDVGCIPETEDIMAQANELLVNITLHAQATTMEALASNQELESKNRSLQAECCQLEKRATSDHLTELHNRSYFDHHVDSFLTEERGQPVPLGVMMCDIDHFKKINDTYGHQFGDAVLKQVARAMSQSLGTNAVVARYGGEEFAVVIHGKEWKAIRETAEGLRKNVEELRLSFGDVSVPITMSIGACLSSTLESTQPNFRQLLMAAADESLYEAKRNGRNQVRFQTSQAAGDATAASASGKPDNLATQFT